MTFEYFESKFCSLKKMRNVNIYNKNVDRFSRFIGSALHGVPNKFKL